MTFAVKVVWKDGREEYVSEGLGDRPAVRRRRRDAEEIRDFFEMGMDSDEAQSVDVVQYPGGVSA